MLSEAEQSLEQIVDIVEQSNRRLRELDGDRAAIGGGSRAREFAAPLFFKHREEAGMDWWTSSTLERELELGYGQLKRWCGFGASALKNRRCPYQRVRYGARTLIVIKPTQLHGWILKNTSLMRNPTPIIARLKAMIDKLNPIESENITIKYRKRSRLERLALIDHLQRDLRARPRLQGIQYDDDD